MFCKSWWRIRKLFTSITLPIRTRTSRLRRVRPLAGLLLEELENRVTPASITWVGTAGDHNWNTATNWSTSTVPTATDTVTISQAGAGTINVTAASAAQWVNDTTATLVINSGASLALSAGPYTSNLGQNLTVQQGGTLSVGSGAFITLPATTPNYSTDTLTDNGTLTFSSGDTVTMYSNAAYYTTTQIVVASGGSMTSSGATFNAVDASGSSTQIVVNSGGHLQATNNIFNLDDININNGAMFGSGDFVNNAFNLALYIPAIDVQYLSGSGQNNQQFRGIYIQPGTLTSGQSVALNVIGTVNTSNLFYAFTNAGFTINQGASLAVGPSVGVVLNSVTSNYAINTLTDNGTLTFAAGDTVTMYANGASYTTTQIVVASGGLMTATGVTFNAVDASAGTTQIIVNSGGHLQATNSIFNLDQVNENNGAVVGSGDFVNNAFNLPLYIPAVDIQYLSGSGNNNQQFRGIYIQSGTLTSGQSVALNAIGTVNTSNLFYAFPNAGFTINQGASLAVGPNVSVTMIGVTSNYATNSLTDNGTLAFASGDTVTMYANGASYTTTQIVVGSGGLMTAMGTTFNAVDANVGTTQIVVNSGGHLQATNSTFNIDQLNVNNGAVVGTGDFVNNSFNLAFYIPAIDVQYLSGSGNNNQQFRGIYIQSGTLTSGQSVALNVIGTVNTSNLFYAFPNAGFTINQGASLSVGANVGVTIIGVTSNYATNTLADNGTLSFSTGDIVTMYANGASYTTTQIVVGSGGLMTATGTTFNAVDANVGTTQIVANSGGHFQATNSFFNLDQLTLNSGAVLNGGDLVNNQFNTVLYIPATDVQYLSGAGNNNQQFRNIWLQPGTLTSGQSVALNLIGTVNTANLFYTLPGGGLTINQGASLTVGPNVPVTLYAAPNNSGVSTLSDSGTLSFSSGDTVTLDANVASYTTTQIVVGSGGLMTATGTTFNAVDANVGTTQIVVNSGGHLQATNSFFNADQLNLNNGAVVNPGDFVNNAFNLPFYIPATDIQYLSGSGQNNQQFRGIYIQSGTLTSGQSVALNVIGTVNTYNLEYFFPASFTINAGATLSVGANVPVQIGPSGTNGVTTTIADNGTLTFASGDTVLFNDSGYSYGAQIVAGSGAVLTVTGTYFSESVANNSNGSNFTEIAANSGSQFTASTSNFAVGTFLLGPGSSDSIQQNAFSSQITIDSSATLTMVNNDFTNIPASPVNSGIIATGATTIINLNNNYWGTTVSSTIAAKIKDSHVTSSLPTVVYSQLSSYEPAQTVAAYASTYYAQAAQNVTLAATVISPSGAVNQGTETFTILNGSTTIGTATTGNVVNSSVSVTYALPAGLAPGTYTIQANYSGTSYYNSCTDSSHTLTILAAPTTTTANNAIASYTTGTQNVSLSASIGSGTGGTINEGTVTFTVLQGSTTIGTPVVANVSVGQASASYALPAGASAGPYTIKAVYADSVGNFATSNDVSHTLTITGEPTATAASNASATFSETSQNVNLSATVAGSPDTVNVGTVTFTLLNGATVIGTPVTANVSGGAASASYLVPTSVPAGAYTIQAAYSGAGSFGNSSDSTHSLTIGANTSSTNASAAGATYSVASQSIPLSATVSSPAGTVSEGAETFTILNGSTPIGSTVTANVVGGYASANYTLPAGTAPGAYTIKAVYVGDSNFITSTDASHSLTLSAAGSTTTAANASASYSASAQNLSLSATVTSPSGTVNQGQVTFTILNGASIVGSAVAANVLSGVATATYTLPAGTVLGAYTIQAVYGGTANITGSTDSSHTLTISGEPSTTFANSATTAYSVVSQPVSLTATITSPLNTVNQGTVTFTIMNGSTAIGNPVTVAVASGVASATYLLPASTVAGTYTINAAYNGTANFGNSSDASHTLTVTPVGVSTSAANATGNYNIGSQNISLNAVVTSPAGTVNEGTETFTILSGSTVIGSPVAVSVSNGAAAAVYAVPGGLAAGAYTVKAVYTDASGNLSGATDATHSLIVSTATSSTAALSGSTPYSVAGQSVTVIATVSSSAGLVSQGTASFSILNGATVIAGPSIVNVATGSASTTLTLPAGTAPGSYTISVTYSGTANIAGGSDSSHTLIVSAPPAAIATLSLAAASDSGAPDHPGYTNVTTPTFNVQVNQAGSITVDFNGNHAQDQTLVVSGAGTYAFTAPTLGNGAEVATATFTAGIAGSAQSIYDYVIATTPPQVTTVSPTGGQYTDVSQLQVTFSEPLDLNTFGPAAIALMGPSGAITAYQPVLVSGSTYNVGFPVQTAQGTYNLTIASTVKDYAGNALAANYNSSFSIALPDLAIASTSSPANAAEGSLIPVGWQVANVSATNPTGSSWTDAVYLSSKSTLDGTAIPLIMVNSPASPLAPGANYSRSESIYLPSNLPVGTYNLLFVTDANGGQPESNSSNDVVADPIVLSAPDLQVTGVSGPTSGYEGQTVQLSWTDVNNGNAAANGPWMDSVYLASDSKGDNPVSLGSFEFDGNLAAGASMQLTQHVTLPQTAGTLYFTVTTNSTQSVPEGSSSANNTTVASTPITVTAAQLPDLVVSSITPPANGVLSGASVPISFVVKNQGQAPTSAPVWQDWVILSQSPSLAVTYQGQLNAAGPGGDATLVSQPVVMGINNPSYLNVGDSYQQTVNVPLPINAQGVWYVYVVPDGTGAHHPFAMPEVSRTDKLAISAPFSVTLSPPPELTVSAVKAPAQDFSGQPMAVSWTVTNTGTGPTAATSWTDAVYMSSKSTLDSSATLLGSFPHSGALAAGSNYTNSVNVTLPVGVSGQFYFFVKTDVNGQVFQNGQTAGNVAGTATAETVNLTPPPDLTVTTITAPAQATADHSFTYSYTVTNAGAGATPNSTWNDAVYLSPTSTFNAGTAISLGTRAHQGGLAAGASYTNTVSATFPDGLAGSYYLIVDTDSGNAVFELNKTNNVKAATTAIQATLAPANLVVSSVVAPVNALPGTAVVVSWTVVNESTGDTGVSSWQDSVYVTTGSTLTSSATLLGTFAHNGLLSGNGSYTQSQLVTLPINLLGNYNIFVVADSGGAVYEGSNANNTSSAFSITLSSQVGGQQADLSDLSVVSITSSFGNGSVTVNWTVQNVGTGPTNASYWNDDVWLSTNTTLYSGGTDIYLGAVQHTNVLAAGASYTASATFTLPQSLVPGNYYAIVEANQPKTPPGDSDGEGDQLDYESNLSNNGLSTSSSSPAAPASLSALSVSGVTAPTTATSGSQIPVSWTVTNSGADTGSVSITDSVYLSLDQVFDPTGDQCIGSLTWSGDLANGANYTQNGTFAIPAGVAGTYYVFVETNSRQTVPQAGGANPSAHSAQPVVIQLPAPADLVAGTVTIPASALAGQNFTVNYKVTNAGGSPADGSWTDALYLSSTSQWSSSDTLLGNVAENQNLAPGQGYTGSLTATVPGVAPGNYYVIVRTNIKDSFPETDLSNNESASASTVAIDAPALTLGVAANTTLGSQQSVYYKVVVGAGQTLEAALSSQESAAYNELYVSYGTLPTRANYDYRYSQPFTANQEITIPSTQAGAYYILAYGDDVPTAPENISVEASLLPFSIQSVSPSQVGAGTVTMQVNGAQFNFGTAFQLRNSSGANIAAERVLLQNSSVADVTFNLAGQALGAYDLWAVQSDQTSTELAAGVTVSAPTTNNSVQLNLVVPQLVLVGHTGTITITYGNPGNTDLPAPLILLSAQNALMQVPGLTGYTAAQLQLVGIDPTGSIGTLTPGFQGTITVPFDPTTVGVGLSSQFSLEAIQDPTSPMPWSAVAANDVPLDTSPQQWAGMVSQAESVIGGSWGSVLAFLDANSVQLRLSTKNEADANAAQSVYNFDALLQYAVGVYGSASPVASTPSFPVVGSDGEVTLYNGNVNAQGGPAPLNPTYPTVILIPGFGGFQSGFASLAAAIAADSGNYPNGDVNVLVATWQGATAGPNLAGAVVPWESALHIETAGTDLGDLLDQLDQQGQITFNSTTVIGAGSGNDVGDVAAQYVGGLESAIALNSASPLSGFAPADLSTYYHQSIAYETSSLFGSQQVVAASNQTLITGDLNDPVLLQADGVQWLLAQIEAGNGSVLTSAAAVSADAIPAANDPAPLPTPATLLISIGQVVQAISHDPNNIIGPKGCGTNGLVPIEIPLPYTVQFGNQSSAQAPAQNVVVSENIDPPNLNWGSFRLTGFGFAGHSYTIPANSSYYQTTLHFQGYDVQFTATINESTGVATWTFTTVDPSTGEIPANPSVGLLPPDNSSGVGEGYVSYTIYANPADATGTVISAQAAITFDSAPQLDTPEIFNAVDAGTGLASTVTALPASESSTQFNVSWSGSDAANGSGVKSYTIYVSDNGGAYTPWLTNTALTTAQFSGKDGHSYSFYSVATDNTGNVQTAPTSAQASTIVDAAPPTSSITGLAPFSPASFTVKWSGSHGNGIPIASYNVYVSDNGGAFTPWLTNTTQTSAAYSGQSGHTYGFYSVAVDTLGNQQAAPSKSQAGTTVDTVAPTSSVASLPALSGVNFTLSWSGSDNPGGSGIASYSVYFSDDGGPYAPVVTGTSATSATFTGVSGHTYCFYSFATDAVGNVQSPPTSPQASTTIAQPVVTGVTPTFGPTTGATMVTISGSSLSNASEVLFGTIPGVIQSDTDNHIVVESPIGSLGVVDITVTTPLGVSAPTSADQFTYQVPPADPATSTVTVSSANVRAGSAIIVTLQAKDLDGNNLTTGGATVLFSLGGSGATGSFSPVTDNGNGEYTATFTGNLVGANTITATLNGQPVTTTSPVITVVPGPVSLATSTVTLTSGSIASATTTTATLQARDAEGNNLAQGGLTVAFTLTGAGNQGSFSTVKDNGDGTYTATFTGAVAGGNAITASINGQAVTSQSPTITVTPGAVSLQQSLISLSSGSVASGATTTVTLQTRDAAGNNLTSGGLTVAFALSAGHGTGQFSSVTDNQNGTCTATFTGTLVGSNTIVATINGKAVTSAAPSITVTTGPASPATSSVSLSLGSLAVGASTTVTLQAFDAAGNPATTGGLTVLFSLSADSVGQGKFGAVVDNHNGTYSASFEGSGVGASTVIATIDGQTVASSQPLAIVPSQLSLAESVINLSSSTVASESTTTVTLQTRDAYGNDLTTGGLQVSFALSGGSNNTGSFSNVTDNGDGTYTATFTGIIAGNETVTATIDGQPVTSTPPTIQIVPGPVDLTRSLITVSVPAIQVGGVATVTLQARDSQGNDLTSGGLKVVFSLNGAGLAGSLGNVTDHGNGQYTATYSGTSDGSNSISATIGGQAVASPEPSIAVTGAVFSSAKSTVKLSPTTIASGASTMVTLQVESATGVKETAGGMNVAFKLGSTKGATGIFSSVTDHLNGVYTATFTGEIEGSNTIVATIDGVKVALAPAIKVTPGQYSLSQSVVMAPTNAIAGVPITVTLQAKDAAGNKLTTGGLQVAFSLSGPGTLGAVKDNRNGTYTATFTGTKAGSTAITATIGNVPVTSTAPIIHVAPGPGSPAKSLVSLTSSSLQAGGSITFTLQAVDAQGNPDVSGGLKVAFALANHTGGQGTFSAVTDHKNGTYTATFTGTFAGVNNIVATIGGVKVVTGSPAVTVSPGVVNLAKSTVSLSQASVELGGAITVTLTARDAYGNVETAGGLTVSFMLGGSGDSSMFSSVVDHGNGTYTATFTAGTAGTNTIVAEIGGKPPTSAPVKVTIL